VRTSNALLTGAASAAWLSSAITPREQRVLSLYWSLNMAGHTPGPWLSERNYRSTGSYVISSDGRQLASVNQRLAGLDQRDSEANARLMAASPDMLKALQSLCGENMPTRDDFESARAVIAKATGDTNAN
jgi:hypothetical protein